MQVLRFVLYKENMETQDALSLLARLLWRKPGDFGIAGTKDKRAVTCQHVTLPRQDPRRLAALNAKLRGVRVGDFASVDAMLGLGDLRGNRFRIVLRELEAPAGGDADDDLETSVAADAAALASTGFVNYFGLQRFGAARGAATHHVGRHLLRGDWQAALDLLLRPRDGERDDVRKAREHYAANGDPGAALRMMPKFMVAERAVLGALEQQGKGQLVQALQAIPKTLRLLYLNAYQGYLFNCAATERVRRYGADHAVEGDLVLAPSDDETLTGASRPVRRVTAEEAAAKSVPIDDVVLPVPGHSTELPGNAVADVYTKLAEEDGVSLAGGQHRVPNFSLATLAGDYRALVVKPADVAWKVLRYDDPKQELVQTRLAELEARADPPATDSGKLLALQVDFTLPASTYATMAIRELTRCSAAELGGRTQGDA